METFGEYLKRERESRNISLEEIVQTTKISRRYLIALEQDLFDQLPATTFTKGFIRAYAKHIGLDPEDVILRYLDIYENQVLADQPGWRGRESRKWLFFMIGAAILVALLLVAGILIWRSVQTEEAEPDLPRSLEILEEEEAQIRQLREELGLVTPEPSAPSPQEEAPHPDKGSAEPSATPPVAPSSPQATIESEPGKAPVPPESEGITLQANALEQAWMEVTVDEGVPHEVLLKKGETVRWEGGTSISLVIGNAGGVSLTLNGEPVGQLGPSGKVVRKTFIRESLSTGRTTPD